MVFQLTGLQRNTCKNVDENKIMEEGAQFCSFDFRKKNKLYFYGIENHYNCSQISGLSWKGMVKGNVKKIEFLWKQKKSSSELGVESYV